MKRTLPAWILSGLFLLLGVPASAQHLVGYWHNWDDANAPYIPLDQVDPRYDVIEVSFAMPAVGSDHQMEFVPGETSQAELAVQVATLQGQGRRVLISIGGANGYVHLGSDSARDTFVSTMLGIIAAYGFDGMDIDLEGSSVSTTGGTIAAPADAAIIRLIDAVNTIADDFESQYGHPMMLTMAPETAYVQGGMSAFGGIWGAYLPVIDALRSRIDLLQVQLYNSGSMFGIDGAIYNQGTADFIVGQTEAVIQGFTTAGGFFKAFRQARWPWGCRPAPARRAAVTRTRPPCGPPWSTSWAPVRNLAVTRWCRPVAIPTSAA